MKASVVQMPRCRESYPFSTYLMIDVFQKWNILFCQAISCNWTIYSHMTTIIMSLHSYTQSIDSLFTLAPRHNYGV